MSCTNLFYPNLNDLDLSIKNLSSLSITACTLDSYQELKEKPDGELYYITDTQDIMLGNEFLCKCSDMTFDNSVPKGKFITNCKCCGAKLPKTNSHLVTCEYCGVTQDAYELT